MCIAHYNNNNPAFIIVKHDLRKTTSTAATPDGPQRMYNTKLLHECDEKKTFSLYSKGFTIIVLYNHVFKSLKFQK